MTAIAELNKIPDPGSPAYETVILGGGPAGTGSLVWAAQHGLLSAWLDAGVAIVEQRPWLGGSLGDYALNADSKGTSFLEGVEAPSGEPLLAEVKADPVARELERLRYDRPTLALVDRFERRLGAAIEAEFIRHPNSRIFTGTTALALHLESGGSVAVLVEHPDGRRTTIRAGSAILAIGGRQNTSWDTVDFLCDIDLAELSSKILPSHRVLSQGGAEVVARRLCGLGRPARVVVLGGAHSAFSVAWTLLDRVPDICFGAGGVRLLYRSDPRVTYFSRSEAQADSYGFSEDDVCQATGRVHRLGGLQGDGREVWRRIHGKSGGVDKRAVAQPIRDLSRAELRTLLDGADLIVPALGYRLATVPVFDASGDPVPLASTGPAVDADARLLTAKCRPIPGVFGVGLGSGFVPWGQMAGEVSFTGQQNSLWLYQHGLGQMIYHSARQWAAQQETRIG